MTGPDLARRRQHFKLTQAGLAALTGVTVYTISRIEREPELDPRWCSHLTLLFDKLKQEREAR